MAMQSLSETAAKAAASPPLPSPDRDGRIMAIYQKLAPLLQQHPPECPTRGVIFLDRALEEHLHLIQQRLEIDGIKSNVNDRKAGGLDIHIPADGKELILISPPGIRVLKEICPRLSAELCAIAKNGPENYGFADLKTGLAPVSSAQMAPGDQAFCPSQA